MIYAKNPRYHQATREPSIWPRALAAFVLSFVLVFALTSCAGGVKGLCTAIFSAPNCAAE